MTLHRIFFWWAAAGLCACNTAGKMPGYYAEQHRPQFHFSPEKSWMNDSNGLVYYQGEYHLFYQYYPDSTVWGPLHRGHASSKDLVHWQHLPVALYPDSIGCIFSGSVVVDEQNTAGFAPPGYPEKPLVAIFTYHNLEWERAGRLAMTEIFSPMKILGSLCCGAKTDK